MGASWQPKSKTRKKKEAHAAQAVGERLTALSDEHLRRIGIDGELLEAVRFAKTLKKHGALRRQLQYIGTLMRDQDPEAIEAAVGRVAAPGAADRKLHRRLEDWRDRLLAGDQTLEASLIARLPDDDAKRRLADLVRQARGEGGGAGPNVGRRLFRELRTIAEVLSAQDLQNDGKRSPGAGGAALDGHSSSEEVANADDQASAEGRTV